MKAILNWCMRALGCPFFSGLFIFLISVTALSAAYTAQYGFGLLPCILCLYQRIPFAIGVLLGLLVIISGKVKKTGLTLSLLVLSGFTFLTNSALAFYHSGVERHWWKGFQGCSAPDLKGLSPEEMIQALQNTPAVRCDEIPWEMFGLSMANYNVAFCFGIAVVCFVAAFRTRKYRNAK